MFAFLFFIGWMVVPCGLIIHRVSSEMYPPLKLMSKRRQIIITTIIFVTATQLVLLTQ